LGASSCWSRHPRPRARLLALRIALRDFLRADSPPRRAYVVLTPGLGSRGGRPLLAIWLDAPPDAEGRLLPKPDVVCRSDEDLAGPLSARQALRVHEAWIDTGPRPRSKPHWVLTNQDLVIPHRRTLLGRLLLRVGTRLATSAVVPLTIPPPQRGLSAAPELPRFHPRSAVGPGVLLVVIAVGQWFVSAVTHIGGFSPSG
jgi:hypothetical protein